MKTNLTDLLPRRVLAATGPFLATCLLLAGCGSSSHSSTPTQSTSTKTSTSGSASTSTASAPPSSGTALASGLIKQIATSQPQLKNVAAHCPGGPIKSYPVKCHFTATQTASGKTVKFAGTITVSGQSGSSFEYGLNYAPIAH
jgi:hypothetical protein